MSSKVINDVPVKIEAALYNRVNTIGEKLEVKSTTTNIVNAVLRKGLDLKEKELGIKRR